MTAFDDDADDDGDPDAYGMMRRRRPKVPKFSQGRASLERAFSATPARITAECIRMAMFKSAARRVYDVDLHRAPTDDRIAFVVTADTRAPEKDTAAFMRKLAAIAETVNDLGAAHTVMRGIAQLPARGLGAGEQRVFLL